MNYTRYVTCTYHDLDIKNLNIPHMIWAIVGTLEDANDYIKMIRRRKKDTLFGAWDIFLEDEDTSNGWHFNKPVKHFTPRKDHDFFGRLITDLKVVTIVAS